MRAPPFPRSVAELAPWQVFADQLIEQGDRRGAFIAYELSLPASPTKDQLVSFQKQALRVCKVPRSFAATWMLGHVRSLVIANDVSQLIPLLDGGVLPGLRDLFRAPALVNLEQLTLAVRGDSIGRRWKDAMSALPQSCRMFEVHANRLNPDEAARVIEGLPSQVDTLRVWPRYGTDPSWFVTDRFAWVDLRPITLTPPLASSLVTALSSTSRVKVRLGTVVARSSLRGLARVTIGGRDDAALESDDPAGAACLFERTRLESLQARFKVVTAGAQFERRLRESFRLSRSIGPAVQWSDDAVLERDDGAWSIRAEPASLTFSLEGSPLTATPIRLVDGARLLIGGRPWCFRERMG